MIDSLTLDLCLGELLCDLESISTRSLGDVERFIGKRDKLVGACIREKVT